MYRRDWNVEQHTDFFIIAAVMSRPVTVVLASTGNIRVVAVSPVASTTTEPTWTNTTRVTSVKWE